MKLLKFLSVAAASAAMFGAANAATFYLGGGGGDIGKDEVFTSGPAWLEATAINTEEPVAPVLHQTALGLGVKTGDHELAQLDNVGDDEAIALDFGSAAWLDSITLSVAGFYDDIRIYGTNDAAVTAITSGGLSSITSISTLLASATGNGIEGFKTIDLSGITEAYRFLVATIPGGSGDGFRVKYVSAEVVPLPAALPLLLSGLAGLGFASRRRKA
ncbi:VPLPA-CTERM sorting domain-containing protein [Hyphococcus luteus]|nr:VPLPA-CTERM sorting domain-containing protein [Marinicaulis flavus]